MQKKATVIGAGMAGCFMAVCLAKRGYDVDVYEFRPDVRKEPFDSGRSFNLTLYYRGIKAMKEMGMWDEAKKIAVIAEGNAAHYGENKIVYDPFDAQGNEILYTVHRNNMNGALITAAQKYENIRFHFNTRVVALDNIKRTVTIQKEGIEKKEVVATNVVFGADGVNSVVRTNYLDKIKGEATRHFEDWGYKEVHISEVLSKKMGLRMHATHTWPRSNSLLIAFPNPDNTFTLMFNLALEGPKSFAELTTIEAIHAFITADFPDLTPLITEIVDAFNNKPTGKFQTLNNQTWHDGSFMAVVGDAAHALIPFYGQGMCAAFEDCLYLDSLMEKYGDDWTKIFPLYQSYRKKNTDILAQLSRENFYELRDKSRSPFFLFKDKADTLLHKIMPGFWQPPLYVLIAHTDMEYDEAVRLHNRQAKIARNIGLDLVLHTISTPWKVAQKFKTN